MLRLGILASTKGTDLQAVIDAIISKKLNAVISVVVSNKQDAYALERARNHKIKAVFIDAKNKSREEFDKEISNELDKAKAELVLLIGYMRFLSPWFVNKYKNRIMNIHPSLLPKYAGGMDRDVHAEVLKNKEKITGCTLHFVDEGADTGPVIMQKEVKIEKNETVDSLKEKVQKAEQEIIVKAIGLFEKGKINVEGGKVKITMTENKTNTAKLPDKWWKDMKLLAGVTLVVASLAIGLYGKSLLGVFIVNWINKLYSPFYLLTGLSLYGLSWVLLFLGIFLVGWETIKMINNKIHHEVRKKVRETYHVTRDLSKKGYHRTKALHKKGMERISKTSKLITEKLRNQK